MNITESFVSYLHKRADVSNIRDESPMAVYFDLRNLHYYFYYDSINDPVYFRIMLPMVENVTDENRSTVLDKCSTISTGYKVGKAVIVQNSVWLSAETFVYDIGDSCNLLFDRMLVVLQMMFDRYKELSQ